MMRIEDQPKDCIRTYSGLLINVFEPTIEMLSEVDIAHAQSHQCRWAGHIKKYYSVAQHSVLCARLASPKNKKAALFHDGSEAYLLDIPTPIKHRMPEYKLIENKLMEVIAKKFDFQYPFDPEIKVIDKEMLHLEWDSLVLGVKSFKDGREITLRCWSPEEAKDNFLREYELIKEQEMSVPVI